MDLNDIRLKKVKYLLEACTIQAGKTTFDVPRAMVGAITIDNNYETSMFPFFYIGLNVPGWLYVDICNNPHDLFVTLDLKAYLYADTIEDPNVGCFQEYKGKYLAMAAIDTPLTSEKIQMDILKENDTYKKNYNFNDTYLVEFALYNIDSYNAMSKNLNAVVTSADMTSLLAYTLQAGGIKKILMSPLDNKTTYSEFKILPLNAIDEIKYMMYNYKFHKNGTILFFDLDRAYVVSKTPKCTAWATGEYKSVHVMSLTNFNQALGAFSGYFNNSREHYHLLGLQTDQIFATEIGNIPASQSTNQSGGSGQQLIFKTEAALMECFTPNKEFILNVDSPGATVAKLNGKYRIMRVVLELTPAGEYMTPEFKVYLYK